MPLSSRANPIDLVHLSRQTAGDSELEQELLALFSDQCVKHLGTICGQQPQDQKRDAAHTLKGAALAVGAWTVADMASAVEDAFGASSQPKPQLVPIAALEAATLDARATIADFLRAA
jgi:HPt (histidine-containing phosphotransfer) domain-containing protein